jgi:ribosome-binding protein aMBF1 (putative translation factor)
MDGQDWTTVTFKKRPSTLAQQKAQGVVHTVRKDTPDNATGSKPTVSAAILKADPGDIVKPLMVSKEIGRQITDVRVAKKLTRKQLASACSLQESIIASFENATAVWDSNIAQKIGRALGIIIKKPTV